MKCHHQFVRSVPKNCLPEMHSRLQKPVTACLLSRFKMIFILESHKLNIFSFPKSCKLENVHSVNSSNKPAEIIDERSFSVAYLFKPCDPSKMDINVTCRNYCIQSYIANALQQECSV